MPAAGTSTHPREKARSCRANNEILAQAGPAAAILLVRCKDGDTRQVVAAGAADRTSYSWDGSMPDFLAGLDPGSTHDWVRAALDKPTSAKT